ncbi:MAG: hypothetical protein JWR69_4720 [Pedosphaera sp.]|nr:hypothetical protein [Pedosphaera sp.]
MCPLLINRSAGPTLSTYITSNTASHHAGDQGDHDLSSASASFMGYFEKGQSICTGRFRSVLPVQQVRHVGGHAHSQAGGHPSQGHRVFPPETPGDFHLALRKSVPTSGGPRHRRTCPRTDHPGSSRGKSHRDIAISVCGPSVGGNFIPRPEAVNHCKYFVLTPFQFHTWASISS